MNIQLITNRFLKIKKIDLNDDVIKILEKIIYYILM